MYLFSGLRVSIVGIPILSFVFRNEPQLLKFPKRQYQLKQLILTIRHEVILTEVSSGSPSSIIPIEYCDTTLPKSYNITFWILIASGEFC